MEIKGKYATATVHATIIEYEAMDQIKTLLNQPFVENETIRIMPDVHAGAGCVIGYTQTIRNGKVCPNLVGVDIGCGMLTVQIGEKEIDMPKFDRTVRESVPAGRNVHAASTTPKGMLEKLRCFSSLHDKDRLMASLGTLGGGNHFIEIDKDDDGNLYLVIHTGSRNLGLQVAKIYQTRAIASIQTKKKDMLKAEAERLRRTVPAKEIESRLAEFRKAIGGKYSVPESLAYLEGKDYKDYIHDMDICTEFARMNRRAIADALLSGMGLHETESFETIHNYIDTVHGVMRKGAIALYEGEKALIPMNMRDGSLIVVGRGNPDYNCSGPHGAGRLMSRSQAKSTITLEEFKHSMEGIYTTSVGKGTIDESPQAYKGMESILPHLEPTCTLLAHIRPVYNFKASEEDATE